MSLIEKEKSCHVGMTICGLGAQCQRDLAKRVFEKVRAVANGPISAISVVNWVRLAILVYTGLRSRQAALSGVGPSTERHTFSTSFVHTWTV